MSRPERSHREVLERIRELIEEALAMLGGMRGRVRPAHRPLSGALDLIADELERGKP
jgi:hypothetical protein